MHNGRDVLIRVADRRKTLTPTEIRLAKDRKSLLISFEDGNRFELPSEYLRVYSPSADVRGHGPETATLQVGKEHVSIREIEPVGHYAVRLVFDDGHATGIYTWSYLFALGRDQDANWRDYLDRLAAAGHSHGNSDDSGTV